MESEALVDKVVVTLTLVKAKTLANSERVHVKTLGNTMADKIMAKRFFCTLGHVDFDALLNTLAHTLAELQVKKPADKLCDVKVLALVDILAYTLAKKKEKDTYRESRRNVEAKALVKKLAYRLKEERKGQESEHTLGHVQAQSLDNKFSATLAKIKTKTFDGTVRYGGQGTGAQEN